MALVRYSLTAKFPDQPADKSKPKLDKTIRQKIIAGVVQLLEHGLSKPKRDMVSV